MSNTYLWAANQSKLLRAITKTKSTNEAVIKEEYIRIGGLVLDKKVEESSELKLIGSVNQIVDIVNAKPKRRTKKK